jgi:hypothetical protein
LLPDALGDLRTRELLDHGQAGVEAGRDASGREDRAIVDKPRG